MKKLKFEISVRENVRAQETQTVSVNVISSFLSNSARRRNKFTVVRTSIVWY